MSIKKILVLISVFVVSVTICFAAVGNKNSVEDNSYEKELKKARNFYCEGNFEKVEECIDSVAISNEKVSELKNKILLLREKESIYKKNLVNDYRIELRKTVKDGNCYEGFLLMKKIKELLPQEQLISFNNKLSEEKEAILYTLESSRDKKMFLDSIDLFTNEKYVEATKLIYKLYKKYPKFVDYLGMCRFYTVYETSVQRIEKLYSKSINLFKRTRLGEAKNYAEMCYNLNNKSIRIKILLDQINMEIM